MTTDPTPTNSPAAPSLREAINVMHRAGFEGTSWTLGPEEVAHVLALAANPAPTTNKAPDLSEASSGAQTADTMSLDGRGNDSASTTAPASSELEIVGYVPEHQIPAGFQFACLSCRVILENEVALVRLPDAQAQIDALTLERNRWIAACHESVQEARDWRAQYHALRTSQPGTDELMRLADAWVVAAVHEALAAITRQKTNFDSEVAREALRAALARLGAV